jgi:tetratricopeptide (TPR) repeat protein
MKKTIFLMSAFVLIIFITSAFAHAQNNNNQSPENPGEKNLSSFMRNSSSGDGLGKYLANNTSNISGTNYQSYFSPSQITTSVSRSNPGVSANTGSSMNTVTRSDTDLQSSTGSDDISRRLAEITERLNSLQQKLETGGYNTNSATSSNPRKFMPGAKTSEITSTSEMYSGTNENQVSGYQKNNTNFNSHPQNVSSASSRISQPSDSSNNVTGTMTQYTSYDSLDQIKAKLDEMSKSIDSHLQTPRENPAQNRDNSPQYKAANSSSRMDDQLTDFQSYSQFQFDKYFRSAQEQLRLGNFYQAADSFTLASIYEPDNSLCYAGHGHALFAAGQFVSSALFIIRAIELNPDYIQTNIDLVTIAGGRDNIASRITELEQLLKKAPASGLQILTAYVYYRTNQLAEARQIINAAYQDMPNSRATLTLKIAIDTKLNNSN